MAAEPQLLEVARMVMMAVGDGVCCGGVDGGVGWHRQRGVAVGMMYGERWQDSRGSGVGVGGEAAGGGGGAWRRVDMGIG
ncbi:hypothetical protein Tco_1366115, partial [Tanacetum coccineum]